MSNAYKRWTLKDVKHALALYRLGGCEAIDDAISELAEQAEMIEALVEDLRVAVEALHEK